MGIWSSIVDSNESRITDEQLAEFKRMAAEGNLHMIPSKQSGLGRFFAGDKTAAINSIIGKLTANEVQANRSADKDYETRSKLQREAHDLDLKKERVRSKLDIKTEERKLEKGRESKEKEDLRKDTELGKAIAQYRGLDTKGWDDKTLAEFGRAQAFGMGKQGMDMGDAKFQEWAKQAPSETQAAIAKSLKQKATDENTQIEAKAVRPLLASKAKTGAERDISTNKLVGKMADEALPNVEKDAAIKRKIAEGEARKASLIFNNAFDLESERSVTVPSWQQNEVQIPNVINGQRWGDKTIRQSTLHKGGYPVVPADTDKVKSILGSNTILQPQPTAVAAPSVLTSKAPTETQSTLSPIPVQSPLYRMWLEEDAKRRAMSNSFSYPVLR